jgi:post-segregation antitoxin (ccd killing protein)
MRMARVNVYLPDDLARQAKAAHLNISSVTQEALKRELAAGAWNSWLERLKELPSVDVSNEAVLQALDEAREEFGDWVDRRPGH